MQILFIHAIQLCAKYMKQQCSRFYYTVSSQKITWDGFLRLNTNLKLVISVTQIARNTPANISDVIQVRKKCVEVLKQLTLGACSSVNHNFFHPNGTGYMKQEYHHRRV